MSSVKITDTLSPYYQEAIKQLSNRRGLMAAVGQRVANIHREHFDARNQQPNKRGWPKRNFWNRIAGATALDSVTDRDAVVVVADPALNMKIHGGVLTPKRGKYLAIPANEDAYMAGSPREGIGDRLSPMIRHRGGRRRVVALVENAASMVSFRRRKGKMVAVRGGTIAGGRVMYWLKESVTIPKDDNALPSPFLVNFEIGAEAKSFIDRALAGQQSAPPVAASPARKGGRR